MRTITLELLRHGPAHNQLLSPLTDYLALCGNHSAVSFQVPSEHNQMMYRLRALSYILSQESRGFQLNDTARMMGDLFGKIPGLTANLNRDCKDHPENTENVTHLRLILSSSELALLPFELAIAPSGFPGAGQHLSLQPQAPICITRETRRIPEECLVWPKRPKILFVFASPPGLDTVPAQSHLLALRQAITPWLALADDLSGDERSRIVAEHLGVIANATVQTLEQACASGSYTHIHILAHGVSLDTDYDQRYGLAFHSDSTEDGREIVSGERLATILRAPRLAEPGSFNRPAVVTLASCNGGNVGSVAGVGASIAHALHDAGIPMVIASQFPLSFGGSVMMVQDLYRGLLWGEDPRKLLISLRRRLHSFFQETHDWASITAYTSLPPDFDKQLLEASISQANSAIDASLRNADRVLHIYLAQSKRAEKRSVNSFTDNLNAAKQQIVNAKQRLLSLIDTNPEQEAQIQGQLASTQKREAQLRFHAIPDWQLADETERNQVIHDLDLARSRYLKADQLDKESVWAQVQYLSLSLLLASVKNQTAIPALAAHDILAIWLMAEVRIKNAITTQENDSKAWSYGYLAELYLLAPLIPQLREIRPADTFQAMAIDAAKMVSTLMGRDSIHIYSTRRQISRYINWLGVISNDFSQLEATAKNIIAALPGSDRLSSFY
ncbi:CHAT domain-containing protein [Undibacterium sp. Di24W]|uniref:CHAT domain-containing protein n=1 Tax=Undibacterium sp. Di24W TaxID=3413033 RepID=UPI003BEFA063